MNASAVLDAQRNAEINGITNCKFVCGKVWFELLLHIQFAMGHFLMFSKLQIIFIISWLALFLFS